MKYFCIGVFRSGTTSTREYLGSLLDLNAVDWSVVARNYAHYPHDMAPIEASLGEFDVFGDIPYNYMGFIERMIREYPDALFFLSTRDEACWLSSVKRHRATRVEGVSNLITDDTLKRVGVTGVSDEELKASYLDRNSRVVKMFEDAGQSKRLCSFSIEGSEMKEVIDRFLRGHGCPVDKGVGSFPWAERTK